MERKKCCGIESSTDKVFSLNGDGLCEDALQNFQNSMDQRCDTNARHSMFRMVLNEHRDVVDPQVFTMLAAHISNVFFPLHSVLSMKPIWGHALIFDSSIENISICGAIFKNYFKDIGYPQIDPHLKTEDLSVQQIEGIVRKQQLEMQNEHQPMSYMPDNAVCTATLCHRIEIKSSNFTGIPHYMAPQNQLNLVSNANGLRY